jgi:hypothetical protein
MEDYSNQERNALLTNQRKSPFSASNTWYSNLASAIFSLLLYYLFSTFTSNIYYFQSSECIFLRRHCESLANLYYYYSFIAAFFFLTCLVKIDLSGLKFLLQFIVTIIVAVYLVLITNDLFKGEPCGDLYNLCLVWAIYIWVEITCLICMGCCLLCALGTAGLALAVRR